MLCKEREEVVGDWASGLLMSKGWERRTAWMGGEAFLFSNNYLNMMFFSFSVSLLVGILCLCCFFCADYWWLKTDRVGFPQTKG